jgi:hypothetical protein
LAAETPATTGFFFFDGYNFNSGNKTYAVSDPNYNNLAGSTASLVSIIGYEYI